MSKVGIERFNSGRVLPLSVPFSEGTAVGGLVFLSGQLGNVPGTLTLVEGGIRAEARQALNNIVVVLEGQGLGLENLVRCTVMLADIAEWAEFNSVYAEFFADVPMPARSAFGCGGLALGARVEIECTAAR
jgi:2-iminobutanoate/2-iminopropanoate deaminase